MTLINLIFLGFILIFAASIVYTINKLRLPAKIRKAEEFLSAGNQPKASDIVRSILKKKEDYVPARFLRAKILINQKQFLLAIAELNGILTLSHFSDFVEESKIHYMLADLFHQTQQWQKEIEEYKSILKFNPEDATANHRVGHALYALKRYNEATGPLELAFTNNPSLTDCVLPLGVANFHNNKYSNAEPYLIKSLEINKENPEAQFYLGLIHKHIKNYESAVKLLTSAKREKRFFIKSLYNLGEIHYAQEQYEDAIKVLEEGLKTLTGKSEESLSYRYLLAACYEHANKISEALFHWRKISDLSPEYKSTMLKIDEYSKIMENKNQRTLFTSSLDELQPLIAELISRLNFNIVSKKKITQNEYFYKAFNVKRINEPQISLYFNRTTKEISETQIIDFANLMKDENCKSGIYLTTSHFSLKAKNTANNMMIQLFDTNFVTKAVERIVARKNQQ